LTALVVDADESKVASYAAALHTRNINAIWLPSSETAIRYCRKSRIDILICRVILDEMTGYEAAEEVLKEQTVPALMISNYPLVLIRSVRGFNRDCALLLEPFTPEELAERVVTLLERAIK
jgi:DNA-binding response OmpR family regulator